MAWGRFVGGRPSRLVLVSGSKIGARGVIELSFPETARYCSVRLDGKGPDIRIHGVARFDMWLNEPTGTVTINGEGITVRVGQHLTPFVRNNTGWIVSEGGEDVN